jgi:hypothetical protein
VLLQFEFEASRLHVYLDATPRQGIVYGSGECLIIAYL